MQKDKMNILEKITDFNVFKNACINMINMYWTKSMINDRNFKRIACDDRWQINDIHYEEFISLNIDISWDQVHSNIVILWIYIV